MDNNQIQHYRDMHLYEMMRNHMLPEIANTLSKMGSDVDWKTMDLAKEKLELFNHLHYEIFEKNTAAWLDSIETEKERNQFANQMLEVYTIAQRMTNTIQNIYDSRTI